MSLILHATWASLASAHRVHAGYAKAERVNATYSIWLWSFMAGLCCYLVITDPGIGRFILLAIGALGVSLAVFVRHEAGKRYEDHAAQADKYQMLAYGTRHYSTENR